jgi:hypothetical protein
MCNSTKGQTIANFHFSKLPNSMYTHFVWLISGCVLCFYDKNDESDLSGKWGNKDRLALFTLSQKVSEFFIAHMFLARILFLAHNFYA